MLCSISTQRSSSNWLDRLRTSKGFPIPSDLDLDDFLSSNPNPQAPSVPKPSPPSPESAAETKIVDEKDRVFHLMTSVLAELFIVGDPQVPPPIRTLASRKSSRKPRNPKICVPSASGSRAVSPSSADNSVAGAKKGRMKAKKKRGSAGPVDSDLSAYSRTEVTVIDTSSSPWWKSEKVVFRKGMVWKVKDKKGRSVCRKKRRVGMVERLGSEREKGKNGVDLKVGEGKGQLASLHEGCNHPDKREDSKETDDQILIPRRRPKFSRSPRIPASKDSSVFRLKVITARKKNGASGHKNTPKAK